MESPPPSHILRSHSFPIVALFISDDNERIYSGDASGYVFVTSTRSLRPLTSWKAHQEGLLGLQEWDSQIVTHGRDNKLHIWNRVEDVAESIRLGGSATLQECPAPILAYSMDVNALNYCRFSLLPQNSSALIALPNLVESSEADVWALPSCSRIHAGIGKTKDSPIISQDGRGGSKTGIIMSLHLYNFTEQPDDKPSSSQVISELRLLCAYEDGSVALRRYARIDKQISVEGIGWEVIWSVKLHAEAVMAMAVSPNNRLALSVSADHLIGRYDLQMRQASADTACTVHRTKHPQNGCVSLRDDGRVCAVGGWDGRIRLYSTKKLKPLGTLKYHKVNCQAVSFARSNDSLSGHHDDEDDMTETERAERRHWLVAGAKDNRVSIWTLIDFEQAT